MNSTTPNEVLDTIKNDLRVYLCALESLNKEAIQILVDFYELYLIRGPKPWFGEKVSFEKFLDKITRYTKLSVHNNGNTVVPFAYIAPDNYTWKLNEKKLAKLTGSDSSKDEFITKTRIIRLACVEMFYMTSIRESYSTIEKIDTYKNTLLVDVSIANLHKRALTSTSRIKQYGIEL